MRRGEIISSCKWNVVELSEGGGVGDGGERGGKIREKKDVK